MEVFARVSQGDVVDAVFDLATIPVVLAFDSCGVVTAFRGPGPGLVDAADRHCVGVFGGNDALASITKFFFVPNDRFEEPLEGAWCNTLVQCNHFGVLTLHAR